VSTVDLRVDYLQPGLAADLVCEAEVVRMGNRVGVMRAQVYSKALPDPDPGSDERPIATAQGVYNIVRRD
jgi:acyl-coenzyme A thioesterase PaaI-like protein